MTSRVWKFSSFAAVTLFALCIAAFTSSCGRERDDSFAVALESTPESLHPWRGLDASGERLRQLMFNTLVRKNENFDYVGELASEIQTSDDRLTYTFKLHDNVYFHDGRQLTAADAKYSLETLIGVKTEYKKTASFIETGTAKPQSYIAAIEAPDKLILIVRLRKTWTPLLGNLVAIAIIPEGSAAQQSTKPVGSGAFKFVKADESQGIYEFQGFAEHWQGAPFIKDMRVRVIRDANTLQAELRSKRIDFAPGYSPLSPDAYKALSKTAGIQVRQFSGANLAYLSFNVQSETIKDARVRQAIAYAIDRETIVEKLLLEQARVAHSILPEQSWAYAPGTIYSYDPQRAKQILDEAGYIDPDGDGVRMRFAKPIAFKLSSASSVRQYSEVIQNYLRAVGIPASVETMELTTLIAAQRAGQYQMTTGRWVGGNQDPIFLKDLFATGGAFNRNLYSDKRVDALLQEAVSLGNGEQSKGLYTEVQQIISRDVPMFPLWYTDNMAVGVKGISDMKIDPSGDWSYFRSLKMN